MANEVKYSFVEKLLNIQTKMKATKDLYNDYGGFSYRSAESILEAFKPFAEKYKVCLMLTDEIELVGDRVYVKATATLSDVESKEGVSVSAYAREPLAKKGMDESQITGTASSYARKYALNGLFILDDNKDADTNEHRKQIDNAPDLKEIFPEPKKKKAAKKEAPAAKDDPARVELREFIHLNGLDAGVIMSVCGIGPESTPKDYENALIYAKSLIC